MREIVLDTETTGLDPSGGHKIVEIGCIMLENHLPTGEFYHTYINPQRDMPSGAFNVHGLSEEFLRDHPPFVRIAEDFISFIADLPLVIHNASFDIGFLNYELKLAGLQPLAGNRAIDTLQIARNKHPAGPNSLDALCRRYGVDNTSRVKHGAIIDCELLAQVYLELIGGRQPGLSLVSSNRTRSDDKTATSASSKKRPVKLKPGISEAEIKAHQSHIRSLGQNAVWSRYIKMAEPSASDG